MNEGLRKEGYARRSLQEKGRGGMCWSRVIKKRLLHYSCGLGRCSIQVGMEHALYIYVVGGQR